MVVCIHIATWRQARLGQAWHASGAAGSTHQQYQPSACFLTKSGGARLVHQLQGVVGPARRREQASPPVLLSILLGSSSSSSSSNSSNSKGTQQCCLQGGWNRPISLPQAHEPAPCPPACLTTRKMPALPGHWVATRHSCSPAAIGGVASEASEAHGYARIGLGNHCTLHAQGSAGSWYAAVNFTSELNSALTQNRCCGRRME